MLHVRKIDLYGQLIVGILAIFSVPILSGVSLLLGLFLIGCWQVISAVFNTNSFVRAGFKKRIFHYWTFCIVDLILLFLCYSPFTLDRNNIIIEALSGITLLGAIAISVYYWKIYFRLINLISLRDELDGLTKSKH